MILCIIFFLNRVKVKKKIGLSKAKVKPVNMFQNEQQVFVFEQYFLRRKGLEQPIGQFI